MSPIFDVVGKVFRDTAADRIDVINLRRLDPVRARHDPLGHVSGGRQSEAWRPGFAALNETRSAARQVSVNNRLFAGMRRLISALD